MYNYIAKVLDIILFNHYHFFFFTDFDGTLFVFIEGNYVMRITERGFLDRIRTNSLFRRAPWSMDAAYNIPSLGRTYFMRGIT